ncbi:ubiquitin-like protein Atg12 [Globomyces pollinis-pini]|nr:ubiquitin-like protein Atg12 [Globomyces pollinis-pini]
MTANPYKVVIRLKAIGNAPILKQQVFKLSSQNNFIKIINFIRKELNLPQNDSLFVYVNSAFCPNPDDFIGDLDACFGIDGSLIVNYSTTPAWG